MKTAKNENLTGYFEFGPYQFDAEDHLLFKHGKEIHLTPKVAEILLVLLTHHGRLVTKEMLMHEIWEDTVVEENNLTRNISTLRKALTEDSDVEYIETIPRRGYRFVAEARLVNEPCHPESVAESYSHSPKVEFEPVQSFAPDPAFNDAQSEAPISETEQENSPEPEGRESSKINPAKKRSLVSSRLLLNALLLILLALFLFWQFRSFYRSSDLSKQRASTEIFSQLHLDRQTTNGIPQVAELSPDGKYIAYASADESGKQAIYLGQVNANNAKRLMPFSEAKYLGLNFSPSGTDLYFTRCEDFRNCVLYRLEMLSDASPQKLVSLGQSGAARLSPDGTRIAFVRESAPHQGTDLLIAKTDGSGEHKLTELKHPDFVSMTSSPSWSPDGKTLVCIVGNLTNKMRYQIASISTDTSSKQALNLYPGKWPWIDQVAWLPNGRELLLLADEEPGGWRDQLWLMTWPEGTLRRLTNDLNEYSGLSPAIHSNLLVTIQSNLLSDLWIVPVQSGEQSRRISSFNDRREGVRGMDWTSDGRLLFSSVENGREHIWSMLPDGSQRCNLTAQNNSDSNNYSPHSSPDGRQIVFVSDRQGKHRIWRMNIDGSQPQPLTEGQDDQDPHITADGLWVIYSSAKSGNRTLWKVQLDGGKEIQLTDELAEAPATSPNGNLIAYLQGKSEVIPQRRMTVIDAEFRQPPLWISLPESITQVRWIPNRKALSYQMQQNGIAQIWNQPLSGGRPTRITDLSFDNVVSFAWAGDGKRLALARVQELRSIVLINGLK